MNPLNSVLSNCQFLLNYLNELKIKKEKGNLSENDQKFLKIECQNKIVDIYSQSKIL